MAYQISAKSIDKIEVAALRYKGKYTDCGQYFSKIFGAIFFKTKPLPPMLLCYDSKYKADNADIEVCVPVRAGAKSDKVEIKTLPEIKALTTIHIGPYSELKAAYSAVKEFAETNNIKVCAPSREVYKKGPGALFKGNPEKYITEVVFPIEK